MRLNDCILRYNVFNEKFNVSENPQVHHSLAGLELVNR